MLTEYGSFFDQENPPVPVVECVAEYDASGPYEVDSGAIFKTQDGKFIGVTISGCSCWPGRGSTEWSKVADTPGELVNFFTDSSWIANFPDMLKMIENGGRLFGLPL